MSGRVLIFFLIRIVGSGVQTASTRPIGHFWPIVLAPSDCEDGEFGGIKIGRENGRTRRKLASRVTYSTTNPTWPDPGANPGRRSGKPATNSLSCDTGFLNVFNCILNYISVFLVRFLYRRMHPWVLRLFKLSSPPPHTHTEATNILLSKNGL
jgi:hypothetical protein